MTEAEMLAQLQALNSAYDLLLARVSAIESMALPKGEYFEQLKASFEGSLECASCTVPP